MFVVFRQIMESRRGRRSKANVTPTRPSRVSESESGPSAGFILPIDDPPQLLSPSEVPDIAGEEQVILNRRGIVRQHLKKQKKKLYS